MYKNIERIEKVKDMMKNSRSNRIRLKITRLCIFAMSFLAYSGVVKAGGGLQLGLSSSYVMGAWYSLSGVDGSDLQDNPEKGFVRSSLALHYESKNNAVVVDILGEVGRLVLEDRRLGISAGIRPILGRTKNKNFSGKDKRKDKEFSILELAIGINIGFVSWLAEGVKLTTDAYYYQSPEVVSLGDLQGTKMLGVKVALPVIATSEFYVAYDNLSGELKDRYGGKNFDIIDTFSIGVRLGL